MKEMGWNIWKNRMNRLERTRGLRGERKKRRNREEEGKCLGGSLDNPSNMFIF